MKPKGQLSYQNQSITGFTGASQPGDFKLSVINTRCELMKSPTP
jgi:hypothetical protein